ncbi:hypothetical protein [Maribacter aestuarii]|uniref:hypothetical protein n=1 Tax=Maribacter aestuarii TaxID=1130723 RepID=UPI0025A5192A|nr:hypothetical protein [Maribacter aestuarii]
MRKKMYYQEKERNDFIKKLEGAFDVLWKAKNELNEQGIPKITCEDIRDGNFQAYFEKYHKNEQSKSQITKNIIYGKYLELYGYNTEELSKLESSYKSYLNKEHSFYAINHSFYNYCETFWRQIAGLKEYADNPPKKKVFKLFDFMTIKGNDFTLDVPKELFTLYATNKKQLETMELVKEYVGVAKKLNLAAESIVEPLSSYLDVRKGGWGSVNNVGISEDLDRIDFDYNKILTIR